MKGRTKSRSEPGLGSRGVRNKSDVCSLQESVGDVHTMRRSIIHVQQDPVVCKHVLPPAPQGESHPVQNPHKDMSVHCLWMPHKLMVHQASFVKEAHKH